MNYYDVWRLQIVAKRRSSYSLTLPYRTRTTLEALFFNPSAVAAATVTL